MGSMMGGAGSAAYVWVPVVLVLVMVVLAAAGWLALSGRAQRHGRGESGKERAEEAPRAILQRRYAAGEIDEDEYLRRLAGLSQR